MEIRSGNPYPSCSLSNFAVHPFIIDDIECYSMEGFLQSLKFKEVEVQKEVCKLYGLGAKRRGANKNWRKKQILYWQGREYKRSSKEYQELLDRAYECLAQNPNFRKALLSTKGMTLTHSMGRDKERETILTKREFCSRLMNIRDKIERGEL